DRTPFDRDPGARPATSIHHTHAEPRRSSGSRRHILRRLVARRSPACDERGHDHQREDPGRAHRFIVHGAIHPIPECSRRERSFIPCAATRRAHRTLDSTLTTPTLAPTLRVKEPLPWRAPACRTRTRRG